MFFGSIFSDKIMKDKKRGCILAKGHTLKFMVKL